MEELSITVGNTFPLEFSLLDQNDLPESLSGADKAVFEMKESYQSAAPVLKRDTDSGNLTIDSANSQLDATLTLSESEALPPGFYVGQCAIRFGDDESWYFTDIFRVRVLPAVAERI